MARTGPSPAHQCEGKSRQTGQRCKAWAVNGRRWCKFHGGQVHRGADAVTFKHGRYSRVLSGPLGAYVAAVQQADEDDPAAQRENLQLYYARVNQLLDEIDQRQARSWGEARSIYATMRAAIDDPEAFQRAFDALGPVLEDGAGADATWRKIDESMDRVAKLAGVEIRRRQLAADMVEAERFNAAMAAIEVLIRENVPAGPARRALAEGIIALGVGSAWGEPPRRIA